MAKDDNTMDFLDDLFNDFEDDSAAKKDEEPKKEEQKKDDNFDFLDVFAEEEKKQEVETEQKPAEAEVEKPVAEEPVKEKKPVEKKEEDPKEEKPKKEKTEPKKEEPAVVEEKSVEKQKEAPVEEKKPEEKKPVEEKKEESVPEPKVEVTVKEEKPKRRGRKPAKEKPELKGEILKDTENLDPDFMKSLLVLPGEEFKKQMNHIVDLMNEIDLPTDLDAANAKIMYSKNFYLGREIDSIAFTWHNMYESLTNKDYGLIKTVKDQAKLKTEGTATDKELAAQLAISNYTFNGKTIDLNQYANALRAANSFIMQAKEFQKTTGMVLSSFVKLKD